MTASDSFEPAGLHLKNAQRDLLHVDLHDVAALKLLHQHVQNIPAGPYSGCVIN